MKQITQEQVNELIEKSDAFTDGGEWAVINGGGILISIDAVLVGEEVTYLVEIRETGCDVMGPEDCAPLVDMNWTAAWVSEDHAEAVQFYAGKITESALHRLQNSI